MLSTTMNASTPTNTIQILGAGPVGCLAATLLSQRGFQTRIYERRSDSRKQGAYGGRSINLALSDRGFMSLAKAGLDGEIKSVGLPMSGRMVHHKGGQVGYQPYGQEGQAIYSVSRSGLNFKLMDLAEAHGIPIHFEARCLEVDLVQKSLQMESPQGQHRETYSVLLGTDGAYSALRGSLQKTDRFDYSQTYLPHGYKELHIPPTASGDFAMDPGGLHIWPRGQYMMIALPNPDRSFTCTLFMPYEADPGRGVRVGLNDLHTDEAVQAFFEEDFADTLPLMPDLLRDFHHNPTSSLMTVRCAPWNYDAALILGDAAHAIVPFYGQGLNAGFEDVRVLTDFLDQAELQPDSETGLWAEVFAAFAQARKADADAIAQLALDNFVEMRDKVADPRFVYQKRLEARMQERHPQRWIPLYSQVTFQPEIPYHQAYRHGQDQQHFMDRILDQIPEESREDWDWIDRMLDREMETLP